MKSIIHLIPMSISHLPPEYWMPKKTRNLISTIEHFIVEKPKTARALLKSIGIMKNIHDINIYNINDFIEYQKIKQFLNNLKFHNIGLISEAGCPAIADPGSLIISVAHSMNFIIKPHVGPSSIILGLMSSGMNGQNFCFRGYPPIKSDIRIKTLLNWEKESKLNNQTQIFIETPYRNESIFKTMIDILKEDTKLCIARYILSENEYIKTKSIKEWKNDYEQIVLNKMPVIFLFMSN
ncbi:Ribosomal RNA small subunit methyltransferase I [Candidatus Kinetoplastibacterium sorsogonicusi]|uniref:Ribosomal RNA small subunit methyltransferase I n=1 Tax=Candidatus Kinetoplastidibacterium kentomonadis TaxID=1576550 RepID=A0A3S7JA79_9PROT|nr:SAM-dependent methyltransferase [Candidatus Kinetoplastibacterium sorsogonicusi]AWD32561.1 Ribosomal RNA small subunit methyltransferase I [Candidatus Kinetoplastibacterium sorsogonicusi]